MIHFPKYVSYITTKSSVSYVAFRQFVLHIYVEFSGEKSLLFECCIFHGNHRFNVMYASCIILSKKIISREQLKHCLYKFKICGVKYLPQHVMYKLRFMKYNFSPVNIIFHLPLLLSSAGFWDTMSFPLESPACSWEKLNARKIQEMFVLRNICNPTNDMLW
jgi:hypothetical protein